jgi:hypothetical protein
MCLKETGAAEQKKLGFLSFSQCFTYSLHPTSAKVDPRGETNSPKLAMTPQGMTCSSDC